MNTSTIRNVAREVLLIRSFTTEHTRVAVRSAGRGVAAYLLGFELGAYGISLQSIQGIASKGNTPAEAHVLLELAGVYAVRRFKTGDTHFELTFDVNDPGDFHSEANIIRRVLVLFPKPERFYKGLQLDAAELVNTNYSAILKAANRLASGDILHADDISKIVEL